MRAFSAISTGLLRVFHGFFTGFSRSDLGSGAPGGLHRGLQTPPGT